ncbi:hypothetical protein FA13DRAFT_1579818, partial [Coprinellus micaceus]
MLKFAYTFREAIDELTSERSLGLRDLELDDDEWNIVKQLRDSLKIFKSVSVIFSSDTPSLPSVIPAMDMINRMLDGTASDDTLNESIQAALSLGHNLLYKYYKLTDLSDVYRIAMILHPGHKTRYFKKAGMDDAWISKAIEMVCEEFEHAYAD